MRGGHEQVLGEVILLGGRPARTHTAAALGAVFVEVGALDVALAADGDDHRLVGNHVLGGEVAAHVVYFGAAGVAVALLDFLQLSFDDAALQVFRLQHRLEVVNQAHQLLVLGHDFVAFQAREALQTHVEDGAGLNLAQRKSLDELPAGHLPVARAANEGNHLVEVVEGDEQTFQDVGALLRFGQLVAGAAHHHLGAVLHEVLNQLLEVERHRASLHQADVVDAERALQLRVLKQVVEHHAGHGVAPQVVHDAHAVAVAFVAHVGNALNLLVVDERGGLLNHRRLVHHVGNFGDDNLLLAGLGRLKRGLGAHDYPPAPGLKRLLHALVAVNDAPRREVRRRDVLHQLRNGDVLVVEVSHNAVHHLGHVVGRHVGGHAHGNAGSAVHQQVRKLGGQHARLLQRVVEVGLKVHRVLVEVAEQLIGQALQAGLGVAHGGRRVAIHRAKVALPIYQRVAQAPVLGHAHHRVVHAAVAVRVVFAQHLAHDTGRFLVGFIVGDAQVAHAVEHAPVHGLEAVAHVGQGPGDDNRHRVIDVSPAHLVFDVNRNDFFAFRHLGGYEAAGEARFYRVCGRVVNGSIYVREDTPKSPQRQP